MKIIYSTLLSLLFYADAQAALLAPEGQGQKLEKATLSPAAAATIEGEKITLTSIGSGVRAKKVVFLNVKVYVGQLFATTSTTFNKAENEALGSLKDQKAVAFQLHFLRNVDAESVQKSFKEALKANKIDIEDNSIKQFLEFVAKGGEAKDGKTLTILGVRLKDGSEAIYYESNNGVSSEIKGSTGLIEKVFSIWLGKPADEGVAELKKSLLKN